MPMNHVESKSEKATSNMRFMQMVFGAVGSAIMFGLVGAGAKTLMDMAGTQIATATAASQGFQWAMLASSQVILPVLGLAGIAAVGLSCVYIGAKYLAKVVSLEQENQAQKIVQAKKESKSIAFDIQPTTIEKTNLIPGITASEKASDTDTLNAVNDNHQIAAAYTRPNEASSRIDANTAANAGRVDERQRQLA